MIRLGALTLVLACTGTPRAARTDPLAELAVRDPYPGASDPEALAALDPEVASDELYGQAIAAYVARDYLVAARRFMLAARPILLSGSSFNGDLMARNRRAYYTNAQRAWRKAGAEAEARAALTAAAARDPDNAQAIAALVSELVPA